MVGRDFSGMQVGRYLLSSLLGAGAAGSVYQAVDTTLDHSPTFAVKCISESPIIQRRHQQIAEIVNHNAVARCPHVMTLCDVIEMARYFFLVLPLCKMDMFRAIWEERVYWRNDGLIKKAFVEILDGVLACHEKGVFHRDLKPENIMCDMDGLRIEVGDFGLSTNRRLCRAHGCGTSFYMSPECCGEEGIIYYADPADVWSLGVILFNMVTCGYPWGIARPLDKKYRAFLLKKDYLLHTFPISESLSSLLRQILNPIPMMRLSIPEIRKAILKMDTFYKPPHSSHIASPLSKEVVLADSQRTCVASGDHPNDTKKGAVVQACVPNWRPASGRSSTVSLALEDKETTEFFPRFPLELAWSDRSRQTVM